MRFFILSLLFSAYVFGYDEPKYSVSDSQGNIELREYGAMVVAEVHTKGHRKEAIKDGVYVLVDYIFGSNDAKKKLALTAPVMEQTKDTTSSIANLLQSNNWVIRCILPKEYSLETAPKPVSSRIALSHVPEGKFAVIRFSGRTGDDNIIPHLETLNAYIAGKKFIPMGSPIFAYYNPPWTLPFFRRNEIMIPISM